jgi:hypothetical protein
MRWAVDTEPADVLIARAAYCHCNRSLQEVQGAILANLIVRYAPESAYGGSGAPRYVASSELPSAVRRGAAVVSEAWDTYIIGHYLCEL